MDNRLFDECKTFEEVKNLYRVLAKQHHPDCGGTVEDMQMLNNAYDEAIKRLMKGDTRSQEHQEAEILRNEQYRQAVEKVIMLPDIKLELIGVWIWATGKTFEVKDQLKEAGFKFSGKEKSWYFRTEEHGSRKKSATTMDMDEKRAKFGSEDINTGKKKNRKKVAANV